MYVRAWGREKEHHGRCVCGGGGITDAGERVRYVFREMGDGFTARWRSGVTGLPPQKRDRIALRGVHAQEKPCRWLGMRGSGTHLLLDHILISEGFPSGPLVRSRPEEGGPSEGGRLDGGDEDVIPGRVHGAVAGAASLREVIARPVPLR